jgi:hypothetical protein
MTASEMYYTLILWVPMLILTHLISEGILHYTKKWRKHAASRVICEMCQKPRKIRLTKDGKVKACRMCRKLYIESLKQEIVDGNA